MTIWNLAGALLLVLLGLFVTRKLSRLERMQHESEQKSKLIEELTKRTGAVVLGDGP
jgi:hypothetical protein